MDGRPFGASGNFSAGGANLSGGGEGGMLVAPVREGIRVRSQEPATVLDGTVDLERDRVLVERCQSGDGAAFEELYHRYHRRLFHFCLRRLHESHEAEDAVQEAFTRAWRALPGFAGDRRFYPWLTVIAGNICTDVLRRRSRLTPTDDVPRSHADIESHDIDEALMTQVDTDMAARALQNLSDRHQRVLRLREASGWSTQRIAEYEGVAVPAAETLLWRARQALKREFAALADTGARLGIGLGVGLVALKRLVGRSVARVAAGIAGHIPVLQPESLGRPVALAASVVLAVGAVGGAILITAPGSSHPASVAMPPAARSLRGAATSPRSGTVRSDSRTGTSGPSGAPGASSTAAPAIQPASTSSGSGGADSPGGAGTSVLPAASVPGPVSGLPSTVTSLPLTVASLPATVSSLPSTVTSMVGSAVTQVTGAAHPVVSGTTTVLTRLLTGLGALGSTTLSR
ncbi:MAG: RNA polymerase sigma factor [Acidimicrobiales bacterium]